MRPRGLLALGLYPAPILRIEIPRADLFADSEKQERHLGERYCSRTEEEQVMDEMNGKTENDQDAVIIAAAQGMGESTHEEQASEAEPMSMASQIGQELSASTAALSSTMGIETDISMGMTSQFSLTASSLAMDYRGQARDHCGLGGSSLVLNDIHNETQAGAPTRALSAEVIKPHEPFLSTNGSSTSPSSIRRDYQEFQHRFAKIPVVMEYADPDEQTHQQRQRQQLHHPVVGDQSFVNLMLNTDAARGGGTVSRREILTPEEEDPEKREGRISGDTSPQVIVHSGLQSPPHSAALRSIEGREPRMGEETRLLVQSTSTTYLPSRPYGHISSSDHRGSNRNSSRSNCDAGNNVDSTISLLVDPLRCDPASTAAPATPFVVVDISRNQIVTDAFIPSSAYISPFARSVTPPLPPQKTSAMDPMEANFASRNQIVLKN
ncbi:hypothetical protein EDD11_008080 [Mortierella claussenii]|nr:hypothetical protein EDD11_008080 [Mortierella claussenii]